VTSKNYKILVLPSGAATGIISSSILAQLELDIGIPVHQQFDEIWCSSIGSMIAALLTTPKPSSVRSSPQAPKPSPLSAAAVTDFLEHSFSNSVRALLIRGKFKKQLSAGALLGDTLIPLRVLSAEVTRFTGGLWPRETQFRNFHSKTDGQISLASVVSSSCTVFPLHPLAESVRDVKGRRIYCIDAGCEVCTESCMNPLQQHFEEFSKSINPQQDRVAIYFISNGWVRLMASADGVSAWGGGGTSHVKLFNIDVSLSPVIRGWQEGTRWGGLFKRLRNERVLNNLIGGGLIPLKTLKAEALKITQTSEAYKAMRASLL